MPWRETDDSYRIWLSEVMLQQTRVDQALPYYLRFLDAFPTLPDLAAADLDDVLVKWEGLGYYSRARNFYRAVQQVAEQYDGHVPSDYDAFRALPGVGPYTAAAVLSIAFGGPYAVLDGNVIRVLTRVFGVEDNAKKTSTLRRLQATADALLDTEQPGRFNEAMMELGATVCTPRSPACPACPVRTVCTAFAEGDPEHYPNVPKKKPTPHFDIAVAVISDADGRMLIQQRPEDGLLGGLWEFPGGKREADESLEAACAREVREELGLNVDVGAGFAPIKHAYSHFRITLYAFACTVVSGTPHSDAGRPFRWVTPDELDGYAFPRANRRLIEQLAHRAQNPSLFDG